MSADERLNFWERAGGKGRWGIGVAVDITAIEARLDALESSRPVQPAPETAAAGAGDPGREGQPVLTAEDREAILFCVSCAQDYRDGLETNDHHGRERWDRATKMIQTAAKLAVNVEPQTLPPRETWPHNIRPRDEATDEAVPDDAGRRLVNGEPMTAAELMHALTVARQEIARMAAESERLEKENDELRGHSDFDDQQIARLTAERDTALRERDKEKQKLREYEHMVMTGRSEQHDRLVAERDAALREVERHRMTLEERQAVAYFGMLHGSPRESDAKRAACLNRLLDRTKEVE